MAIVGQRVVLTYEDYLDLPNDRNRYEILEGELEVNPAPSTVHQTVVGNLFSLLLAHTRTRRLGKVLTAPCDVVLSDTSVVQPDILFVARERSAIVEHACVRGAPDLVVEIISPTTERTDRDVKRQIYERYGVANYWVIHPIRQEVVAYVLGERGYAEAARVSGTQPFSAPPFPDLSIALSDLWE